jgi:GNAT superfamily N-acetyltransferase
MVIRQAGDTDSIRHANLTFRENLRPADREAIHEIIPSSGVFSQTEIEIAMELVQEGQTRGAAGNYRFLLAEQEGRVVGYTCYGLIPGTTASYDLYWIAVHNNCRGLGVGKSLLAETEERIARAGGRRIYVETSSRDQYKPTHQFYLHCGYHLEAFLRDFYAPGDGKLIYLKITR